MAPISQEEQLEFIWVELSDLEDSKIFPKGILPDLIKKSFSSPASKAIWYSTTRK